jgi:NAD-dependent SIR2 family protein deacetylase
MLEQAGETDELSELVALVRRRGALVLSGAGLSTASGIPAYRGRDGVRRVTPMTIAEFRGSSEARRRYWARAYVGWRRFADSGPNEGHRAIATLQRGGYVGAVITQNVDRLHQRAGTADVIDLHGRLAVVRCLACGDEADRDLIHAQLGDLNPGFRPAVAAVVRPDGDVDLAPEDIASFRVPRCRWCGSDMLKPDVVFFGESVPPPLVERCFALAESARSVLVLGSSLQVMSGLRFVRRAAACDIPVAIVNQGSTRADDLASIRIDADVCQVLASVLVALPERMGSEAG